MNHSVSSAVSKRAVVGWFKHIYSNKWTLALNIQCMKMIYGGIERDMRLCLPLSVISMLKERSLSTDVIYCWLGTSVVRIYVMASLNSPCHNPL